MSVAAETIGINPYYQVAEELGYDDPARIASDAEVAQSFRKNTREPSSTRVYSAGHQGMQKR